MEEISAFYAHLGMVLDEFRSGINEAKEGIGSLEDEAKRKGEAFDRAGDQSVDALKRTGDESQRTADRLKDVAREVERSRESIRRFGTQLQMIGGIITGALTAAVYKSIEAGDQVEKMSRRTGIAVEELSRLGHVAELSGTSLDRMAYGMQYLYRYMDQAAQGSEEAREKFRRLKVEWEDVDGSLRGGQEILMDIADAVAELGTEAEQTAAAGELLGRRAGPDLVPMLQQGSAAMRTMAAEADRLGITMSEEQAKRFAQLKDSITAVKSAFAGLIREGVEALIPMIQPMIERVTELIARFREWREENRALFDAMARVAALVGPVTLLAGGFLKLLVSVSKMTAGLQGLGFTIGVLKADIAKFMAFFTTPAGIAIAAIAAIAAATMVLIDRWRGVTREVEEASRELQRLREAGAGIDEITAALARAEGAIERARAATDGWTTALRVIRGLFLGALADPIIIRRIADTERAIYDLRLETEMAAEAVGIRLADGFKDATEETRQQIIEYGKLQEIYKNLAADAERYGRLAEMMAADLNEMVEQGISTTSDQYRAVYRLWEEAVANQEMLHNKAISAELDFLRVREDLAKQGIDLEKQSVETRLQINQEYIDAREEMERQHQERLKQAQEDFGSSIIAMANQLRERMRDTLNVGLIETFEEAEAYINRVISDLGQQRADIIAEWSREIVRLEEEAAQARLQIEEDLLRGIEEIEKRKADVRRQYAEREKRLSDDVRVNLIRDLAEYGENVDRLVDQSTQSLAELWKAYVDRDAPTVEIKDEDLRKIEQYAQAWRQAGEEIQFRQQIEELLGLSDRLAEELRKLDDEIDQLRESARVAAEGIESELKQAINATHERFKELVANIDREIVSIRERLYVMYRDYSDNIIAMGEEAHRQIQELASQFGVEVDRVISYANSAFSAIQGVSTAISDLRGQLAGIGDVSISMPVPEVQAVNIVEQVAEGAKQGSQEGSREGSQEGSKQGSYEGAKQGSEEGAREGMKDAGDEISDKIGDTVEQTVKPVADQVSDKLDENTMAIDDSVEATYQEIADRERLASTIYEQKQATDDLIEDMQNLDNTVEDSISSTDDLVIATGESVRGMGALSQGLHEMAESFRVGVSAVDPRGRSIFEIPSGVPYVEQLNEYREAVALQKRTAEAQVQYYENLARGVAPTPGISDREMKNLDRVAKSLADTFKNLESVVKNVSSSLGRMSSKPNVDIFEKASMVGTLR